MQEIPVRPSKPVEYRLTEADKKRLKDAAVNGVIPFNDYIRIINEILKKNSTVCISEDDIF